MTTTHCKQCGERMSWLARACGYCGARNAAFGPLVIGGSVLGALLVAGVVAVLSLSRGEGEGGDASGDYSWLVAALKKCDAEAEKDKGSLHLMVVPLVDDPKDDDGWRRASLNDIGNAILLSSENMIAGLKRGALKISRQQYVLAIRDEATSTILRWKPSVGVKRFATKAADDAITAFKVQFQPPDGAGGNDWGSTFKRQIGNCYWVNAILRR